MDFSKSPEEVKTAAHFVFDAGKKHTFSLCQKSIYIAPLILKFRFALEERAVGRWTFIIISLIVYSREDSSESVKHRVVVFATQSSYQIAQLL